MNKNYFFAALFCLVAIFSSSAQTYEQWGLNSGGHDWDTLYNNGDVSTFEFTNIPAGAWGTAKLVVYQDGDFGDTDEYYEAYDNGTSDYIGRTGNNLMGDCTLDSFVVNFSTVDLLTWQSAGTWLLDMEPTFEVDPICGMSDDLYRVRVRLIFEYCSFGAPIEFAQITNTETQTCAMYSPITLTGTPAAGTYSGTGVSGNSFNPQGLATGTYIISYTATDGIGCETTGTKEIKIASRPGDIILTLCEGQNAPAVEPINKEFVYAYDVNFNNAIDTVAGYSHGAITNSPTSLYYANITFNDLFTLDNVTNNNSDVIDHDFETGDDRGGIAITDNYVFVVGDDYSARYNLDLTNPLVLPQRNGLFTDLKERKVWSIYDNANTSLPGDYPTNYMIDALIALDDNLDITSEIVMLSMPIPMGNDNNQNNGIFAGYGKVGIYNGDTEDFYVVDITTGDVELINNLYLDLYWGENWADWGTLSFDGTDYIANYANSIYPQSIMAHNITTDISTSISNFTDMDQMASFVYHPTNGRIYFHYEYGAQFGGSDETLGYVDADATIVENPNGTVGCPSLIEYSFNTIDLGNDVTICGDQTPYILEAGFGYNSYTWNGVNNNWNIYPVSTSNTYTVEATDDAGCVVTDEIVVTVDANCTAGVEELTSESFNIYPVPNNGNFTIDFAQELDIVTVSIIDLNGKVCFNSSVNGTASKVNVQAENLQPGVYIVNVESKTDIARTQIVISK